MKANLTLFLILHIPLISFTQNDSVGIGKKKSHFGFLMQYGLVMPKLHTDYDYSTTNGKALGIGLTYEYDLNERLSLCQSIQYNVVTKTRFNILENKDKYSKDFILNYYIDPHFDLNLKFGVKYQIKANKGNKNVLIIGSGLGWGISKFLLSKYQNSLWVYHLNYYFADGQYGNYFQTYFSISKSFLIGKSMRIEPMVNYNISLNSIKHPPIIIDNTQYFSAAKAHFSFNSVLFGLAFSF
jgi:hypothetical protein